MATTHWDLRLTPFVFFGFIDRHNYFGGQLNDTLLSQPGSGYTGECFRGDIQLRDRFSGHFQQPLNSLL